MKALLAPVVLCLCLTPVWAQQVEPAPKADEGFSLMEEGAKLLFRGLMDEMEPALDDMAKAMAEAEPVMREMLRLMGDIRNYHAPEMQPNGDILIRRKTPAELAMPDGPEIEL
ncbi:hypothetical protein [Rhodobacter ferrooxidans]|uniref:AAA+ family ATPase n=1 Tax=Rhodobacter ferrooxidans TaxID=371731 RepID=C8S1F7_9RHOB|nr:hypothetical protein [Rhodobacter sp. SW2]EEW25130.1 conserved hypothetical protein [Rhodobacter sp. SW2]